MTALIIFAVLSVIFWILPERLKKDIEVAFAHNPKIMPPDGKSASTLTTFNFVGMTLFGDFRHYEVDGEDTFVAYYCICILIPLIPLKCYRVIKKKGDRYYFVGSEQMTGKELFCIYANALKWVFSIVTVILLIEQL